MGRCQERGQIRGRWGGLEWPPNIEERLFQALSDQLSFGFQKPRSPSFPLKGWGPGALVEPHWKPRQLLGVARRGFIGDAATKEARGGLALIRRLSGELSFSLGDPRLEGLVGGGSHRAFPWQR